MNYIMETIHSDDTDKFDLERMLDLVKARPVERLIDFPSIADLQEMLGTRNPLLHIQLWEEASGKLAGFALLRDYQTWAFLVMEVSCSITVMEIEEHMAAWGEQTAHHLSSARNSPLPLEVNVKADEGARIALLEALGFERLSDGPVSLSRSLVEPIPAPDVSPDFLIRPFGGEPEIEEWVRLHRLAWGTEIMTVEERRSMLHTPFYDPSLDLVAAASDGSLAAYCVCWISAEENALTGHKDGHTDPIATHPVFQRHGLAKALILTGLGLLKERGMYTARLGTARDNLAMLRTAESLGFRITSQTLWFSKTIAADPLKKQD
jgi:mycothiol synthase